MPSGVFLTRGLAILSQVRPSPSTLLAGSTCDGPCAPTPHCQLPPYAREWGCLILNCDFQTVKQNKLSFPKELLSSTSSNETPDPSRGHALGRREQGNSHGTGCQETTNWPALWLPSWQCDFSSATIVISFTPGPHQNSCPRRALEPAELCAKFVSFIKFPRFR